MNYKSQGRRPLGVLFCNGYKGSAFYLLIDFPIKMTVKMNLEQVFF